VANLGNLLRPFLPGIAAEVGKFLALDFSAPVVGKDQWQKVYPEANKLGEISKLRPLVKKLEL
ncbi:MAG: hypothetical protein ACOCXP_03525, partial [Candidatus Dojkabacteria bacterium]